jgi:hypothetical protein
MTSKKNQIFIGERNKRKIAKEIITDCHSESESNLLSFDFITEKKLQKILIKTYKEACFVSSLTKVLHINFSDSHPLNEIQIIHYGAICEAIIGSIFKTNSTLSQHKTEDKIGNLVELGIISANLGNDIRTLWDIRNNIHLHKAKGTNEKFFKKHLTNKKDIIFDLCESIESNLNNPI